MLEGYRAELANLPTVCLKDVAHVLQRAEITDRLESALQELTGIFARHPFSNGRELLFDLDFEEESSPTSHPSHDLEFLAEKRVNGVLNCYNTLVAGIIMFALASVATQRIKIDNALVANSIVFVVLALLPDDHRTGKSARSTIGFESTRSVG